MNNRIFQQQKKQLIKKAEKLFGRIHPCLNKSSLDECFTLTKDNGLIFWFNTDDNSTHMVSTGEVAVYDVVTLEKLQKNLKELPDEE
jgi:hypothetical protein